MVHMRRSTNGRRLLYAAILVAVVAFFRIAGYDGLIDLRQSWQQERELESEVQQLRDENGRIEDGIEELSPDGPAIERIARQELGWAKHGEIVIKIPEKK